jgi:putative transposase
LSPTRRRQAVVHVCQRLEVSQRRACQVLSQPRGTQRYTPRRVNEDQALVGDMKRLSRLHPRYGYRRITALLRTEGWCVNRKRVYRLWRQEGLKVPGKKGKHKRLGDSENGCLCRRAEHINHVWSYDFVSDQTEDGRRLKLLVVLDEYTRESLAIEVERHIKAPDVLATLEYLFAVRGTPQYLRSDNGPEFVAEAIPQWLKKSGVQTLYITPGSPWENAYIESFNSRLRDELLNVEVFGNLREARVLVEDYRRRYNHHRPHSSLHYVTPAAFAAACLASAPASAGPAPTPNREEVAANSLIRTGT